MKKLIQACAPANLAIAVCCLIACALTLGRLADLREANAALEERLALYGQAIEALSAQMGRAFDSVNARMDGLDAPVLQSAEPLAPDVTQPPLADAPDASMQQAAPPVKPAPAAASAPAEPEDEIISEPEAPLASQPEPDTEADAVMRGDVLTIRVSAPEVNDMYGYQFRLEYDSGSFAPAGGPTSLVADMQTIFKKEFDGYILIGATMTGDVAGFSASGAPVCELKLAALSDGALPEISVSKVNVVSSAMDYRENVDGWTFEILAGGEH